MSADRWTVCPKCNARNPDSDPDGDYAGTMRMDFDVDYCSPTFTLSMHCYMCNYSHSWTQKDLP
jgi:hypothetical protein